MSQAYTVGIDIGSSSIKAVILSHKGKNPSLYSFGSIPSPSPGMNSDAEVDLEATALAVKNLLELIKSPISSAAAALPESRIFTRVVTDLPFLSDEDLSSAIKYMAEEFVPLPTDQVNIYWQVIDRSKEHKFTHVFIVASPKALVNKYIKVLQIAKLKVVALETELIAAMRSLVGINPFAPTTLVVQMGASSTDLAIASKGMILLTRSLATGGFALTRAVAQYLNFEVNQSEQYKKVYGMLQDQLEGKIYQVLKPLIDVIITEMSRVIQVYQAKNPQNPIKRVVLSGGGAKLPGLVVYLAEKLGLEVQEADPWYFLEKDPKLQAKLSEEAPFYSVAMGLALRDEQ